MVFSQKISPWPHMINPPKCVSEASEASEALMPLPQDSVRRIRNASCSGYAILFYIDADGKIHVLMIRNQKRYAFPGGTMEPTEAPIVEYSSLSWSSRQAADLNTMIRETIEETGLKQLLLHELTLFMKSRKYVWTSGSSGDADAATVVKHMGFYHFANIGPAMTELGIGPDEVVALANRLRQVEEVEEVKFMPVDEVWLAAKAVTLGVEHDGWTMQERLAGFITTDPSGPVRDSPTLSDFFKPKWVPECLRRMRQLAWDALCVRALVSM